MAHCGVDKKGIVPNGILLDLSHKITGEWKNIARFLQLPEGTINHIAVDNSNNVQEQIYQMLISWKQSKSQLASYGELSQALRQASRHDLADTIPLPGEGETFHAPNRQHCKGDITQEYSSNVTPLTTIASNETFKSPQAFLGTTVVKDDDVIHTAAASSYGGAYLRDSGNGRVEGRSVGKTRNEGSPPVKVISVIASDQTVKTDVQDVQEGKVETIRNVVRTKPKNIGNDLVEGTPQNGHSTVLIAPDKILFGEEGDKLRLTDSFQDKHLDKDEDNTFSTCKDHKELKLSKYCLTCRRRLCLECVFLFHKNQCDVISIHDVAEKIEELSLKLHENVKSVSKNCETIKIESDKNKNVCLGYLDEVENKIRDGAIKMREIVDREEHRLLSIVQDKRMEISKGASEQSDYCLNVEEKLRTIDQECSKKINNRKDITQWEELLMLQHEVNMLQNSLDEQFVNLPTSFQTPVYQSTSNEGVFGEIKYCHLLGGVIIKQNQLLQIYDNRKDGAGILLACIDMGDPKSTCWQYKENRATQEYPVVMSRRSMYYKEYFHALFACGKNVYVVHFHSDGSTYDRVKNIEVQEIESLEDGTWITSLFCHQPTGAPCDHFIFSTNLSDKIIEYSISSKEKRIINLTGFVSHINVISVAYLKSRFALIDGNSKRVTLLSIEGENVFLSHLPGMASSSVYEPVEIISTGARWIVLCINREIDSRWKVLVYKIKTGDMRVCDEGKFESKAIVPIGVTHCQRKGFMCFSNGEVRSFDF